MMGVCVCLMRKIQYVRNNKKEKDSIPNNPIDSLLTSDKLADP